MRSTYQMKRSLLQDSIDKLHLCYCTEDNVECIKDFYNSDSTLTWDEFAEQATKIPYDDQVCDFTIKLKNGTWLYRYRSDNEIKWLHLQNHSNFTMK